MHTYVHCGTVYNSKDLEPTQMSINDKLDKENVAHIHHGILCSHKKTMSSCPCRDMDESGNHHSQQTDTRTENQTPHVLTYSRVLNNENTWTQGGEHHTLGSVAGGLGEKQQGWGRKAGEEKHWEMPEVGDRGTEIANHHGMSVPMQQPCGMCTCSPELKVH